VDSDYGQLSILIMEFMVSCSDLLIDITRPGSRGRRLGIRGMDGTPVLSYRLNGRSWFSSEALEPIEDR
jgi:hypothetical protein